jgi:hypothetical protein
MLTRAVGFPDRGVLTTGYGILCVVGARALAEMFGPAAGLVVARVQHHLVRSSQRPDSPLVEEAVGLTVVHLAIHELTDLAVPGAAEGAGPDEAVTLPFEPCEKSINHIHVGRLAD